ncbi:MAG: SPFH domain-containing protein [Planctomycetaceae bacterium]|nr:MAG: SPFH domain-containing protein [Planctomycetaceae bacterium]
MGLFDKLRAEFVDIIEWIDDDRHTLVWRFPRYQNEIKQGAQLIVRPGQMAVFVHRGQLADVFEPGNYELKTENLPILSTLQGWKYGFNSPFRSEVYFVATRQVTDLKWGTPNPIMLRDADFGPIRLRAFGTYALKCVDPRALLKELVGTDSVLNSDEIGELMRSIILSALADMLGSSKIAALDLASNYRDLGEQLRKSVVERVDDEYGLDVPILNIVNISLPEEVEKAIDTRSSIGVIGDLGRYQQFQMGKAITMAAENPSGGASAGVGLGMGFGMANQMASQMGSAFARPGAMPGAAGNQAPPPPPGGEAWHVAVNGQSHGPFTVAQLAEGFSLGQIDRSTQVWSAGMAGWQAISEVPALATRLTPATPPPPPVPPAPPTPPK